jgi:hypothetical protein
MFEDDVDELRVLFQRVSESRSELAQDGQSRTEDRFRERVIHTRTELLVNADRSHH